MANYPSPGRGAWKRTGGLLPAKPGSTSKVGYYRLATKDEIPIGSLWLKADRSHHEYVVHLGVEAIQKLVGADPDGWFGPLTDAAVRRAQRTLNVEDDGIVGPVTMRALLPIPEIAWVSEVPIAVLGGVLTHESKLDPAAVGVNGQDHGLAQINLRAHTQVSVEQALDPDFVIHWTAKELRDVYQTWAGRTKADPWDIAIANHNSPKAAKQWALAGVAPYDEGRAIQIAEYVDRVRAAW